MTSQRIRYASAPGNAAEISESTTNSTPSQTGSSIKIFILAAALLACKKKPREAKVGEMLLKLFRKQTDSRPRFEQDAGALEVAECGPTVLEDDGRVAGRHLGRGRMDPGTPAGAPTHGDERLGLEDAKRLAERRPRDAELPHEHVLGRQGVAVLQLTADDAVAHVLGDDLCGLGYADGVRPVLDLLVPHERSLYVEVTLR